LVVAPDSAPPAPPARRSAPGLRLSGALGADLVAIGAFCLIVLFLERGVLLGGTVAGMDSATFFYPWFGFLGERLREGHIPLWNPHLFGGAPFAADPESGWMYLPAMLAFSLLPLDPAATSYMVGHILLAGLSTYALARALGLSPLGALTAGVAYAFTGFLFGHDLCCFAYAGVVAWLPLALLGLERALGTRTLPRRLAWWSVSALALSQILAVWIGTGAYFALLVFGTYTVYRTLVQPPAVLEARARFERLVVDGGVILLLTLGLAAAGLLPRLEFNALTNLSGGYPASALPQHPEGLSWGFLDDWQHLLLSPGFYYVGSATLALALAGVVLGRGRYASPYFAVLTLVVLILSRYELTPLHVLFGLIPAYAQLAARSPERTMLVFYLGPALLAGSAVSRLGATRPRASLALLVAAAAGIGLALGAGDLVPSTSFVAWAAACLVVGMALAVPRARGLAAALALAVVIVDLGTASSAQLADAMHEEGAYQLRKLDLASYYAAAPADRFLQDQARAAPARYFGFAQHVFGDVMPYTLRWTDPKIEALDANDRALRLDLDDIQGYNPVHLTRYGEYMALVNGMSQDYHHADVLPSGIGSALLDPLNARYLVLPATPASDQRPPDLVRQYPLVYQDDTVQIRENPWALRRAWIVHDARQVEPGGALDALASGALDPHTTALIEQAPPPLAPATAAESVDWLRQDPDELALRADASAPGLVVLSETYDPSWSATVDGQPAPVLVADHILRAVAVPAGQHTIRLHYAPPLMTVGLLITGGTLVLIAGLLITFRKIGSGLERV
jgi:hypothetical protein